MGLYYLQSRYYDPELCRFLNADAFISTGQGELGNNMFAYCRNNPVCRIDISGDADADFFEADGKPLESEDIEKDAYGGSFYGSTATNGGSASNLGSHNSQAPNGPNANSNQPGNNNSATTGSNGLPRNGSHVSTDQVIDMSIEFLGPGYTEKSPGRFVSADGTRQVRMGTADLLGTHAGAPHVNFNLLSPSYKNVHVFFHD